MRGALSSRRFCVNPDANLSAFLKGRGRLPIQSLGGSFTVSRITITMTGAPA